ncbi:MFS transporter [Paenibacillus rhizoplanae]
MFLVILDSTIMNVAVPKLVSAFDTNLSTIQWVITAYTLSLSAVIPLAGWFSDRFSPKRMFMTSIVLFVLASVLCAMATTPEQLIFFRIVQGLGGGMVAPIGIATVFMVAPPDKKRICHGHPRDPDAACSHSRPVIVGLANRVHQLALDFSSTYRLAF